jgi:hypothetical protein
MIKRCSHPITKSDSALLPDTVSQLYSESGRYLFGRLGHFDSSGQGETEKNAIELLIPAAIVFIE